MEQNNKKRRAASKKRAISSDVESMVTISDEAVEFCDKGIVKKIKPKTTRSRRVNTSTPCWKCFTVPGLDENSSKCSKYAVHMVCVDKNNMLTTTCTALNSHL